MKNKEIDQKILSIVLKSDGTFNSSKAKKSYLNSHFSEYLNYLNERFDDLNINDNYKEILYRLQNDIETTPLCPICDKPVIFDGRKYPIFCSVECHKSIEGKKYMIQLSKKTCLEKYGVEYAMQVNSIKEKSKQTCLEKYGVENAMQNKEICNKVQVALKNRSEEQKKESRHKVKQTCLERYGVENAMQCKEIQDKVKQTCLERYGTEYSTQNKEIHNKAKQTCLEKYGVENVSQYKDVKEKIKQTCLERYGTEYITQTDIQKEKSKQTCLKRYSTEYAMQNKAIHDKFKQTCLERYGVEYSAQNKEIYNKVKQTCLERYGVENAMQCKEIQDKVKQTCLERYGVENSMQCKEIMNKSWEQKKLKGNLGSSDIENQLKEYFNNYDIKYEHNYNKDIRYPYHVDFYLIDYDLFIEIQGTWTHGGHPYNQNNIKDKEILKYWESKNSKYYEQAIKTWTISDVNKRNKAKQNNLNYLEIFSCNLNDAIKEIKKYIC